MAVSGCTSFDPVILVVDYTGDWNGTITDSAGTRTIEGNGVKTIDLGSIDGSLYVKVVKKESSNDTLTLTATRGDKTVSTANSSTSSGGELDDAILSVFLTR